jgi:hypothetical protein
MCRAEKIRHNRVAATLNALEEQGGAALRDHPSMNFGQFQKGINFRFDSDKIVFASEEIKECAEVSMHDESSDE